EWRRKPDVACDAEDEREKSGPASSEAAAQNRGGKAEHKRRVLNRPPEKVRQDERARAGSRGQDQRPRPRSEWHPRQRRHRTIGPATEGRFLKIRTRSRTTPQHG